MSTESKPLKAYCVKDEEQSAVIVFATNSASARREGGNELSCEWEGVESCRRAPWADRFADTRVVPAKAWIDNGYWCSCGGGCDRQVNGGVQEEEDEDGNPFELEPVFVGDTVYCSQACKEASDAAAAARKARKQEVLDAVVAEFPGITNIWANDHENDRGARFNFPGGKNPVTWRLGEETALVSREDIDAWKKYRSLSREA